MTLDKLTEPYLYGDDQADPVETRTVHARIDMQASTATLQAIGADKLAIQIAEALAP